MVKRALDFIQQNKSAFMMMFALLALFLMPDGALAAAQNPLSAMKDIYIEQAETQAFPVLIVWILILGIVIAFSMGKFMPFILAVIAAVIIGVAPELAPNFTGTYIKPTGGW